MLKTELFIIIDFLRLVYTCFDYVIPKVNQIA